MEEQPGLYFEFNRLLDWDRDHRARLQAIRTPQLISVAEAFSDNMDRVWSIPEFIAESLFRSIVIGRATGSIPIITGYPKTDIDLSARTDLQAELSGEYKSRFEEWIAEVDPDKDVYSPERTQFIWRVGSTIFGNSAGRAAARQDEQGTGGAAIVHGTISMMYSMVLNSYAAFETLASDAWAVAVNLNPDLYKGSGDQSPKSIAVQDLKDFGYDTRGRFGDFLVQSEKVKFGSLDGIRRTYAAIYTQQGDPHKVLFAHGATLGKSEKVRHLIAHKSGRVDERFRRECADQNWNDLALHTIGKPLPLTGSQVSNLIDPCVKTAVDLLLAVDKEITPA